MSLERLSTDHLQATTSNKSVKLSLDENDDINAPGIVQVVCVHMLHV